MRKDNQHVIANEIARMVARAQHKLNYFNNRLTRARFIDLPSQRLIRTAEAQARWYADELASLMLELQQVERQYVPQLRVRETRDQDIRGVYPWIIEPEANQSLLLEQALSPEEWGARVHRWLAEPDYYPFSIERYDGTLIGFAVLRCLRNGWESRSSRVEMVILAPQWRSLGYGSEALSRCVELLGHDVHLDEVTLVVECENTQAVKCFEKAGFQAFAIRRLADQDLFDMEWLPGEVAAQPTWESEVSPDMLAMPIPQSILSHQLMGLRQQLSASPE